ncbi:extracellular matrix protein 1 isoform X2 [Struthio camelus]|uniref:extracellular matrix protein 1 isoform X2 n=1 Tax=Struthio camelus TaxID=8801 RepID=UPI003603C8C1
MAAFLLLLLFLVAPPLCLAAAPVLQQERELVLPVLRSPAPSASSPERWGSDLEDFPPGRPAAATIADLCRRPRPRDALGDLPRTGFSHLRRQADALQRLDGRLDACCRRPQPLPCAQQAWAEVLEDFCADEFRVKTRHYYCCKRRGAERERCFAAAASPAPLELQPPPATAAAVPPLPQPVFPPGEPTAANIGNICRLRKFRPVYGPGAFPPSGFGAAKSRARALARLERDYKTCCRAESVECARAAWQKTLGRFCEEESGVKTKQHRCCKRGRGPARWGCFAGEAPHPAYDRELRNASLARLGPALLDALCGPARLLAKQKPVPALVQSITEACCPRGGAERVACAEDQKSRTIAALCSSQRDSWKDPKRCCAHGTAEEQRRCFDASYLASVLLASTEPELLAAEQD